MFRRRVHCLSGVLDFEFGDGQELKQLNVRLVVPEGIEPTT